MKAQVAIIMGSDSDLPTMDDAVKILKSLRVPYEIKIVSAHRTPQYMVEYAQAAEQRGIKVIIAGAGGAAHLPGMVASLTPLPVIGVPVLVGKMNGLDSLLSIVQMPKGVPVATVGIDNSTNAGLLAARILALDDPKLQTRLLSFSKKQKQKVMLANRRLRRKSGPIPSCG